MVGLNSMYANTTERRECVKNAPLPSSLSKTRSTHVAKQPSVEDIDQDDRVDRIFQGTNSNRWLIKSPAVHFSGRFMALCNVLAPRASGSVCSSSFEALSLPFLAFEAVHVHLT